VVPTPLQSWLSGYRRERPCPVEFFFQWRHFPVKANRVVGVKANRALIRLQLE
jgi:hypothetical protein